MFANQEVEALDVTSCADALVSLVAEQRRVGARRLALSAHFADLHGPGSAGTDTGGHRRVRMVPGGSDGTPEISEFAADELGMLLSQSTRSATGLLHDALDLRHRHPRLWAEVLGGAVDDWVARKVAQTCAVLSEEQARWVDAVTLEAVLGLPVGRALAVVEGKVVAADPVGHDARRQARESRRFVHASRSDDAGLRMLHARTTAADVTRLDAMVAHLADLLHRSGDTSSADHRRATALGLLANPALACVLLAGGLTRPAVPDHADSAAAVAAAEDGPSEAPDEDQPADVIMAARDLGRALVSLGAPAVDRLRPRTVLYLHLAEEALTSPSAAGTHVVRCEGLGAATRTQLHEWLGTTNVTGRTTGHVTVRPVLDLHGQEPVDSYEIPMQLREAMVLSHPFEVFPYGTAASRGPSVDADHTRSWRPPGADEDGTAPPGPGQTRLDNLGPLGRGHHRAKTLGGFTCHQPLPGLYLWRTPAGHWYRVDHTGTHHLGRDEPAILAQARPQPGPPDAARRSPRPVRVDWSTGEHHLRALLERPAA